MATMEKYLTPWITCIDLVAHLRVSLVLGRSLYVHGRILLLLFPKSLKPTRTILIVNKTL